MNKNLLRAIMMRNGDTQEMLASAMGISLSRLNAKINNTNADFRQSEMAFIIKRYKLEASDIDNIFFTH